jgi:predicted NUDIX family NTP pyrophosphohydrolase
MPVVSAGLLMYRTNGTRVQVLLVHPGGPFWAKKDRHAWSIPKGEVDRDEDLLACARREFREETGWTPEGPFIALEPVKQSRKLVYAWAVRGDGDPASIVSSTFRLELPARSGRFHEYPEVDRAGWFDLRAAREKIVKAQADLLDQLNARGISKV